MLETKTFGGFVAKYKKSFVAKLSLSSDDTLAYYSDLKNELLSYKKIKERTSWKYETFRRGRKLIAKLAVRGKTLRLYVALDPSNFEKAIDVSHVKSHASVPCLLKIKNPRRLGYAKALISLAMQEAEVARKEIEYVDYTETFVYRDLESLIAAGLIKVLEHNDIEEVSAYEVNSLMSDEEAEALVEASDREVDRSKKVIVNVDTLSMYFKDGEIVNIETVKRRIPGIDKRATFLKVLARGTLNKKLIVDADDYSLDAEKMILLVGGKVLSTAVEEEEDEE
jgi:ribosomal protein L18E